MDLLEQLSSHIKEKNVNIFDLVLIKDGIWHKKVITPVSPCQDCYSVTKNFTATAIGLLYDSGLLSLDDPILRFLRGDLPSSYSNKLEQVTIRHLLTHTAGFERGFLFEGDRFSCGNDWLRYTLSQPITYEPGTKFLYNNAGYYLLSCIVHRITGSPLQDFLRRELFMPLGIEDFAWSTCPLGEAQGGTGLYLSTEDMAKLGLLYLNGGVYEGKRILSEQWVQQATQTQIESEEYSSGYGYSFWIHTGSKEYRCDGAYQQIVLIMPEENMVLAFHAFTDGFDYYRLIKEIQKTVLP